MMVVKGKALLRRPPPPSTATSSSYLKTTGTVFSFTTNICLMTIICYYKLNIRFAHRVQICLTPDFRISDRQAVLFSIYM